MRIEISFWHYKEELDEYDEHSQIMFLTEVGEIFSVEVAKRHDLMITKIRNGVCLAIFETDKKEKDYKNERRFSEI